MGQLVVISGPSGSGKDTVIKHLTNQIPNSVRFITSNTRPARPREISGITYHTYTHAEFEQKIANGDFIEHNHHFGEYYGTEKQLLENDLAKYKIVFLNIDILGRDTLVNKNIPHLAIYILPESLDALEKRITRRGGLTTKQIHDRITSAQKEIEASKGYDYHITNHEGRLDETVAKIREILTEHTQPSSPLDKKAK